MKTQFQIAQVNIGRIRAPLDDPQMAGFVANLEGINGLADSRPGFVWRLKTDAGDATALRPYDDDRILVNLSVWANPEDLREFVYRSAHAEVMHQRRSWFERFDGMYYALWWVVVGHIPSVAEAKDRLAGIGPVYGLENSVLCEKRRNSNGQEENGGTDP